MLVQLLIAKCGMTMPNTKNELWDYLSQSEGAFVTQICHEMANQQWVQPLIQSIDNNGGFIRENKALLFELRFAYALHRMGAKPNYEIDGEGTSKLDFGFTSANQRWAVELMRLEETKAVRSATHASLDENGVLWSSRLLVTGAEDPKQTPERETLKAVQRICRKCERNGSPHKFPVPNGTYHAILVDFRTFQNGGDVCDRMHIAMGGESVKEQFRYYWDDKLISGAFNPKTEMKGAVFLRQRVHFIGFVDEQKYTPDEFAGAIQFVANPNLFANVSDIREAINTWPLQPARVLNDR